MSGNSRKSLAARLDLILGGRTQHNHRIVELNDDRHGVMFEAQLKKRWSGDGEGGEQFPGATVLGEQEGDNVREWVFHQ